MDHRGIDGLALGIGVIAVAPQPRQARPGQGMLRWSPLILTLSGMIKRGWSRPLALKDGCPLPLTSEEHLERQGQALTWRSDNFGGVAP